MRKEVESQKIAKHFFYTIHLSGKYYGVFLAIRPNEKGLVNTGRETFLLPVDWSGEFPVFQNGLIPLKLKLKMAEGVQNQTGKNGFLPNDNFTFTENFKNKKLDYRWIGIREVRGNFTALTAEGLVLNYFITTIKAKSTTSTLFYGQQHASFKTNTNLK